ncbi:MULTISPECIES: hypothetical protein [Rhodococcus]|uniref:hypothetical protein n=1 Tax=Rhodococcus TaxID=1827 RepID=UPI001E341334|nr:hypothetical protein [Rhodococcus pyridinivorans]MCD2116775.1 hypothetical protein [Rhodococcus pyridinivorans]MCZ4626017.1 hypothetical protein [Rhodococcus pyridinivorans]MCZ4646972.1 hypothetical protein [Rhodococcus pyridinivorans]MDJ0480324.1 hypothetical protein [Rhodococcus pyridinivorans]MDV7253075.1 hypothetical protein [Rhodococcus pyridinivorans]
MTTNERAKRNLAEFKEIFIAPGGTRPLMSEPPRFRASRSFTREVRDELGLDEAQAEHAADWIADKMERYAALHSRPVFDMDGNGPQCSFCSMPWPFCGHHHLSGELSEEEGES